MRILLDSHTLVWYLIASPRCSPGARDAIEAPDATVLVSAVCAWEIASKVRAGKWNEAAQIAMDMDKVLPENGFIPLPISIEHARLAGSIPALHRDPFDRMLAAQAIMENLALVTTDPAFRHFDVRVLW